jgi:hypothetical protein
MKSLLLALAAASLFETLASGRGDIAGQLIVQTATKAISATEYEWTLYIEGPDDAVKRIKRVEYLFDRSFGTQVRLQSSSDKASWFAVSSYGRTSMSATVPFTVAVRLITGEGVTARDVTVRPVQPFPGTEQWNFVQLVREYEAAYNGRNAEAMKKLWLKGIDLAQEYRSDFKKHLRSIEIGDVNIAGSSATMRAIFRDDTVDRFGVQRRTPDKPRPSRIEATKDSESWKLRKVFSND